MKQDCQTFWLKCKKRAKITLKNTIFRNNPHDVTMEKGYQEKGKNQEQKIIIADQKWGVNNE